MRVRESRKRKHNKKQKANPLGLQSRKIPENKLQNALKILNDPKHEVWKDRNIACEPDIHHYRQECSLYQEKTDIFHMDLRLRYAQTCLLRRDWNNLAKIVLLFKPEKSNEYLLRLYAKYASICLAYTNQPLLKSFLQTFHCTEPVETVIKEWTSIPKAD